MDNKHIETFLCVFAECNITRAALKLNIVQPAVSTQLRKLEKELGVELFERSPRGMVPTAAGKALYKLFHSVISDFHVAQVEALQLSQKLIEEIRIGLNPHVIGIVLNSLLQRFDSEYPNIKLHVEEGISTVLLERVLDGSLDLAVISHDGLPKKGLTSTPAIEENLVLVEKANGHDEPLPAIKFSDAVNRGLILPSVHKGYRQVLDNVAEKAGLHLEARLEINSPSTTLEMVVSSNLATILPEITASRARKYFRIQIRKVSDPPLKRQLWVVRRDERPLTPVLTHLIEIVRAELTPEVGPGPGPKPGSADEPQVAPPDFFRNANSAAF